MTNKKFLVLLCVISICFFCLPAFSQQLEIKNVTFSSDDDIVTIQYDLEGMVNKKYKTSLRLSNDGGITFTIQPKTLAGDIGKNIYPGKNKKITWNLTKDFPDGLEGENYVFAVDAQLQKRRLWPYFLAGVPILGGVAYLVLKGSDEEQPTKGSITISVSGDF